jgi:CheY-like chemotaxis protein
MPKTVMIVEDNELNMKLFRDLLEAHGYHTVGTHDGIDALDLARKHRPDGFAMPASSEGPPARHQNADPNAGLSSNH